MTIGPLFVIPSVTNKRETAGSDRESTIDSSCQRHKVIATSGPALSFDAPFPVAELLYDAPPAHIPDDLVFNPGGGSNGYALMVLDGGDIVELGTWDLTARADTQIVFSLRDNSAGHFAEFLFQAWGGTQTPDGKLWLDDVMVTFRSELLVGIERSPSRLASLLVAYPNPLRDEATLQFDVSESGFIRIEVYDALGRRLEVLREKAFPKGKHEVIWDARMLVAGTYIVSLVAEHGHRINQVAFRR